MNSLSKKDLDKIINNAMTPAPFDNGSGAADFAENSGVYADDEDTQNDVNDYQDFIFASHRHHSHHSKHTKTHQSKKDGKISQNSHRTRRSYEPHNNDYDDYIYYSKRNDIPEKNHFPSFSHNRHDDNTDYNRNSKFKTKSKRKRSLPFRILKGLGITVLSLIVIVIAAFLFMRYVGKETLLKQNDVISAPEGVISENNGHIIKYNGHTYRFNENVTSLLFIGVDKTSFGVINGVVGTGGQADAIYLFAIDLTDGKITTFAVPRETMADIQVYSDEGVFLGIEEQQICLAYAYGDGKIQSTERLIDSVERMFYGVNIQSYITMDLLGINAINDSIGGVDVVLESDMNLNGNHYSAGETVHLYGGMAEPYVRSRSVTEVEANLNRMQRQKNYLNSFISKAVQMTKEDISTPLTIYNKASDYTITTIDPASVTFLATELLGKNITAPNIMRVPGEVTMGEEYAEFYIDKTQFYEMFLNVYYNRID
ncbi:MAG: LCP family protein [Clostridiales bacterium]|nr:LCP family protein [Clostridiales bacterium]